ncbi:MAG: hypothetical protein ACRDK3_09170 [Actinomycetota bacterium]
MPDLTVFDPTAAPTLERALREANESLASQQDLPERVRDLIREVAESIVHAPREASLELDPYLIMSVQQAAIQALLALEEEPPGRRREARIALERMRQVFRDVAEGRAVSEDRPPREVVKWLADNLEVPHGVIADIVGVSGRQFQRWISPAESAQPKGEDALRVRVFARLVSNLRHILTGPGVVAWMKTSHPSLEGESPAELLRRSSEPDQLVKLAASARSGAAT